MCSVRSGIRHGRRGRQQRARAHQDRQGRPQPLEGRQAADPRRRRRNLILGGIAGALIGLAAAYLYVKSNEGQIAAVEAGESDKVTKVSPGEALAVGVSLVALIRQIVGMGQLD